LATPPAILADEQKLAVSGGGWRAVAASSAASVLAWYDFCAYLVLAPYLARHFLPNEGVVGLWAVFAIYGAGFLVRPLGAVIFGQIADRLGRPHALLMAMAVLGLSTAAIGLLPGRDSFGPLASTLLVVLRLLQGLGFGGHYGPAAVLAAEHVSDRHRGLATSWIHAGAAVGLLVALLVIALGRLAVGPVEFGSWGWRVPFLASLLPMLALGSLRLMVTESPVFERLNATVQRLDAPAAAALLDGRNVKYVLVAALGAVMGYGVVWYVGHIYPLYFLTVVLKVDETIAAGLVGAALLFSLPFFVLFGWLSDRVGRVKIIVLGCLVAALTWFPIYQGLLRYAHPALQEFRLKVPVSVAGQDCGFRVRLAPQTDCDRVGDMLARHGLSYATLAATPGEAVVATVGSARIRGWDPQAIAEALRSTEYPMTADPGRINVPIVLGLLAALSFYVAMVGGPMAAFLAELFPARIRCTSMSLSFNIGDGWVGGLVPMLAITMAATSGNIYQGLWYPITITLATAAVSMLFMGETKDRSVHTLD
jgi:hypothetical protein